MAGNPATIDAPLAGHRQGNPGPATPPGRSPARKRHDPPHPQHRSQATADVDSRPIRGPEFARLADLPALGFGARFAQLAADGFRGADGHIRPQSAIGP
jgi:hypothetical protein